MTSNQAIILKRMQGYGNKNFVSFKVQLVNNEQIDNFYHFKVFLLDLVPFDLTLDGNFCDEFYKYIMDTLQSTKKINKNQLADDTENVYEKTEVQYDK